MSEGVCGPWVECQVLRDFELRGLWYRRGRIVEFRKETADLLAKAGKVRVIRETGIVIHTRKGSAAMA